MFDEKELSPSALKLLEYMKEGKVFHGSINAKLSELEPMADWWNVAEQSDQRTALPIRACPITLSIQ